jgi:hypothetical protein
MSKLRGVRSCFTVAALLVLPSVALAEVSVQLDGHGTYRRFWYLSGGKGRSAVIWKQVRPHLPPRVILNPLGDTYGDGPPVMQISPVTGYPWVVWQKNYGNIKQLAYSTWDGRTWTQPALVNPGLPLVNDDLDPALAIDQGGKPYLVWTRAGQTAEIYFSTLIQGRWSPAIRLSDPTVESRTPSITLNGSRAVIVYQTPAGPVTKIYETAILVDSGASLMDNPIPPLSTPPTAPPGGGNPTGVNHFVNKPVPI